MRVALHRQSVELALRAGVTMGAGTDWVFPDRSYIAMADELAFLVSCGLSPMQALQAATVVGAEALGESSRLGTIEVGKLADVFAVDGDPIADIRAVSQTVMVMQAGKVVRP
jgi:imidazolonepropionase-like amidohydrolase